MKPTRWCALLAAPLLLLPQSATSQEVRSFIDLSRTKEKPVTSSAEDLEFLKSFARGMNVEINEFGSIPNCQWRSPLKTRGAYVDASNYGGHGWQFYVRAPFPRSGTTLQGLKLSDRPEFPRVAYLEFMGTFDEKSGAPDWDFVHLVLPPVTIPGARFDLFSQANVKGGGVAARRHRILNGPPGLPTRVVLSGDNFDEMLAGLARNGSFTAEVGRLPTSAAPAPRIRVEANFKSLVEDLARIASKLKEMKRSYAADKCKVYASDCMDGQCG